MTKKQLKNRIEDLENQKKQYFNDIQILISDGRLLEKALIKSKYETMLKVENMVWNTCGNVPGGLPDGIYSLLQYTPINDL